MEESHVTWPAPAAGRTLHSDLVPVLQGSQRGAWRGSEHGVAEDRPWRLEPASRHPHEQPRPGNTHWALSRCVLSFRPHSLRAAWGPLLFHCVGEAAGRLGSCITSEVGSGAIPGGASSTHRGGGRSVWGALPARRCPKPGGQVRRNWAGGCSQRLGGRRPARDGRPRTRPSTLCSRLVVSPFVPRSSCFLPCFQHVSFLQKSQWEGVMTAITGPSNRVFTSEKKRPVF